MDVVMGAPPPPYSDHYLSTNYSNLILMMCNPASTPTTLIKGIMNIFTIYVFFLINPFLRTSYSGSYFI